MGAMVKLARYLADNHLSQREFAERIGVDQATVCRWLKGALPRRHHWPAIKDATDGAVTAADFISEPSPNGEAA